MPGVGALKPLRDPLGQLRQSKSPAFQLQPLEGIVQHRFVDLKTRQAVFLRLGTRRETAQLILTGYTQSHGHPLLGGLRLDHRRFQRQVHQRPEYLAIQIVDHLRQPIVGFAVDPLPGLVGHFAPRLLVGLRLGHLVLLSGNAPRHQPEKRNAVEIRSHVAQSRLMADVNLGRHES